MPAPQASQATEIPPAPITPEAALPIAKPEQPEASAPEPVSIQSKEPSLMSKLQAPDKEATVRFTVDMSESLHRKPPYQSSCTAHILSKQLRLDAS
ncbi:hypothetical protein [Microcoleus sp. Z1_B5]|uniref:hypothetical protein n=1 Tax=Microcoleus sp. Z1_B5 TaxID=3055430 RepID=UPI002FCEF04E